MSLTPKQEKFCQCIVAGMSAKDSYNTAYDTNGKDRTSINEANKLLKRDDITARIKELRIPVQNHAQNIAINEREKKRQWLWDMIEHAANDSDRLRAMDILNRMDSEYMYTQIQETKNTEIQELNTDTLLKLVN